MLSPDPRPYGRGDIMSTYEEFMLMIAIANLIAAILNLTHKKIAVLTLEKFKTAIFYSKY